MKNTYFLVLLILLCKPADTFGSFFKCFFTFWLTLQIPHHIQDAFNNSLNDTCRYFSSELKATLKEYGLVHLLESATKKIQEKSEK